MEKKVQCEGGLPPASDDAVRDEETRTLRDSMRELELANMRLEEANRHKSRFLSAMSHELRTPLNAILGFSDLLKGEFFGSLNEKQFSYVDQIQASSKHLLALISDLLDIAKIDAGTMDLDLEELPVEEFIYATQTMMMPQFKEKGIDVDTYVDPQVTTVQADRRKTKQIMLNLLSNALKYTSSGGRVTVRAVLDEAKTLRIAVRDTGVGIAPEDLENVFSDFYQAERARDQQLGGTGIGLALTKRMVQLHGGTISASSEPGQGSTFSFTLPVRQAAGTADNPEPPAQDAPAAGSVPEQRRKRILVAEDETINRNMILDMLSIRGHEARGACHGGEVLEILETFPADLVMMDMRMPVMGGLEVTRELRRRPQFRTLPIIALTANASAHSEHECLSAGCTAYLAKPIRAAALFEALDYYLGEAAEQKPEQEKEEHEHR